MFLSRGTCVASITHLKLLKKAPRFTLPSLPLNSPHLCFLPQLKVLALFWRPVLQAPQHWNTSSYVTSATKKFPAERGECCGSFKNRSSPCGLLTSGIFSRLQSTWSQHGYSRTSMDIHPSKATPQTIRSGDFNHACTFAQLVDLTGRINHPPSLSMKLPPFSFWFPATKPKPISKATQTKIHVQVADAHLVN